MKVTVGILLVVLGLVAVLVVPWAWTYVLNTFGQYLWPNHPVPYTFETWLAGLVVSLILVPRVSTKD